MVPAAAPRNHDRGQRSGRESGACRAAGARDAWDRIIRRAALAGTAHELRVADGPPARRRRVQKPGVPGRIPGIRWPGRSVPFVR